MITSNKNPLIKELQALQKKKKQRNKEKLFIVEGLRAVKEIPDSWRVDKYIISQSFTIDPETTIKDREAELVYVSDNIYAAISDTKTPQGIMAVVSQASFNMDKIISVEKGFFIVADGIQDPGNLGTLVRTAHAAGVDGIFLSKGCVDLYNPKTIRSTMGSIFHIPIFIDISIDKIIQSLKNNQINIYATALEESKLVHDYDYRQKTAIIIGNEANGISKDTKNLVSNFIKIPMPGGAESLNASIAAGICMYEVVRQRNM
ncbi:MAG: RNA methyltransferase [Epulopiscium sp.]|nr:RNA methyltransferase [Candidatus Epulonipiscium sp.]